MRPAKLSARAIVPILSCPAKLSARAIVPILSFLSVTSAALPSLAAPSPNIVISQIYGGGGNSGATLTHDFIELFNRGGAPVDVTGWSVQYASSSGSSWQVTQLSGTIPPGGYYLVQEAQGAGGTQSLPTPDAVGTIAMSGTTGKVALVNSVTALTGTCPATVVDLVGYGSANCFEGSPTPALSNTSAALRAAAGCLETDNNAADFGIAAPAPRNSASALGSCGEAAPAVASTTPANGATGVPSTSSVTVVFSEQVNVSEGAVSVQCPAGTLVAQSGTDNDVNSVTIAPAGGLPLGASCSIVVNRSGISDTDGSDPPDNLAADFVATFTVAGVPACSAADTPIGLIQGAGTSAALTGTRTVQGVVVADYEYPGTGATGDYLRGFFVQNLSGEDDGDPTTSDGIFVFNADNQSVHVGQIVQVTGTVTEFGFSSTGGTLTELTSPTIELCGTMGSVAPTPVSLPVSGPDFLERFEGMLVSFSQTLYVTEHFQLGRFGQVLLSTGDRLLQPTQVAEPGAPANAQQAANDLNRILLDDALQQQNPDPIPFGRGGAPLSASNTLRGGDTLTGLRGVLMQTDATPASNVPATTDPVRYRVRPFHVLNELTPNFQPVNPRPALPASVSGTLRVASANLLNYFNTFGSSACTLGVGGAATECRGASSQTEFARQWPKTVAALLATDAPILVVNELENDGYGPASALADLVNKLNAATAPGTFAFLDVDSRTAQVNALGVDAIRVGMVYKPTVVTPTGATAVLNTDKFGLYQTTNGSIQRNRPALAQAFVRNSGGGRVIVVGNHLKSKGSSCANNLSPVPSDPDTGDRQGECNLTRTAAAEQLATWLATNPTGTAESDVLIMGDLNSYAMEDPIAMLRSFGYVDLIDQFGAQPYSYVFDGQWGYLDHALASPSLVPQVAGAIEVHINADEPNVLDYNTEFKSAGQQTSLYAANAFRGSDHDIVIVGLNLPDPPPAPVPALRAPQLVWVALLLLFAGVLVIPREGMKHSLRVLNPPLAWMLGALATVCFGQTAHAHDLSLAVVVVQFRDQAGPDLGPDTLANLYTKPSAVDRYFRAQSFGALGLTGRDATEGDLYGPLTIDYDSTPCNLAAWRDAVDAELDLSEYDRVLYVIATAKCGFSGKSRPDGQDIWLVSIDAKVIAHELGHSLGLGHANSYWCKGPDGTRAAIASSEECKEREYGDHFDLMGRSSLEMLHYNGYFKGKLAFVPQEAPRTPFTATGRYRLAPLERPASDGTQHVLRIARGSGASSTPSYYYVEYRQADSLEAAGFAPEDPVVNGVTIRVGGEYDDVPAVAKLIDTTPETPTFLDAPLVVGRTYTDRLERLSFTLESATPDYAQLRVQRTRDTVAPGISNVLASQPLHDSVTVTWSTDELSDSYLEYGPTTRYGMSSRVPAWVSRHVVRLGSLRPRTLYHYRVRSRDPAGNQTYTGDASFLTANPPPTNAPVISNVRAAEPVGQTSASISWDTNKPSDAQVEYGPTVWYGRLSALSSALMRRHSVVLSNLNPWTTYHYRVRSRDARGILSVSRDFSFTTDLPQDTTAAAIREVTAAVSRTSARVNWTTDETARGWVDFAPSPTGTSSTPAPTYSRTAHTQLGSSHSRVIEGLVPGTRYEYRVVVMDGFSNWSYDTRRWFITAP